MRIDKLVAPPIETLRRIVRYDANTGKLIWLRREPDLFPDNKGYGRQVFNARYAGNEVAKIRAGYVVVRISLQGEEFEFMGHRLAWALHTGSWPMYEIDHKNGIRNDNRFDNLRDATHFQNNQNKPLMATNKSGFKGVHWSKSIRRWVSQIKVNGAKTRHLGCFDTAEEAAAAYRDAARALQKEFAYET